MCNKIHGILTMSIYKKIRVDYLKTFVNILNKLMLLLQIVFLKYY